MSYVDCQRIGDSILVNERGVDGKRKIKKFRAPYFFYVEDSNGTYDSMFGDKLSRVDFNSGKKFRDARMNNEENGVRMYESDVRSEFKLLEQQYAGSKVDELNVAFLDIEADTKNSEGKGWPRPENPYAAINAVTVYRKWLDSVVTIALVPNGMKIEDADKLIEGLDDMFVVDDERDLLEALISLLEDADVTTGWNSDFYDMPYIVARIRMALGGETQEEVVDKDRQPSMQSVPWLQKLCLFDMLPKAKEVEYFGSMNTTYEFPGRPHLDYRRIYRNFILDEKFSYTLENILMEEIGQGKVKYDGTLEELYANDFRLFCEYNRRDVMGMVQLDEKRKFINLANEMSHMACVLLPQVLGSVSIIEQAILLELHQNRNEIAPDKFSTESSGPVAGAFVQPPTGGLSEWVFSYDVNSLYPSVIRMLNIGAETLVGQIDISGSMDRLDQLVKTGVAKNRTEAWHHFTGVDEYHAIADDGGNPFTMLNLVMEDGNVITKSGTEWNEFFRNGPLSLSANGTVFSTEKQSILAYCMEKWYNERKQFKKKMYGFLEEAAARSASVGEDEEYHRLKEQAKYWDTIQNARKLFLNSTYGSLLNAGFRWYDTRMGQSVTLSGRIVDKHMARKAGEIMTGKYEFSKDLITCDTDSVYVTATDLVEELAAAAGKKPDDIIDDIVEMADAIGYEINDSFGPKMAECFFVTIESGVIIQAAREVVARRGLFKDAKKRYALWVIDKEGERKSFMKIMGMETQRSDTPKFVQEFLQECLVMIVRDALGENELRKKISNFVEKFRERDHWTNGRPCRVSNISSLARIRRMYEDGIDPLTGKRVNIDNPRIHFSVIAGDNTNRYVEFFGENAMDIIRDGDKIQVLDLKRDQKTNPLGHKSIALPVDGDFVPEWFKRLPFDNNSAEDKLIHKKIDNVFGVLGWNLVPPKTHADDVFSFKRDTA